MCDHGQPQPVTAVQRADHDTVHAGMQHLIAAGSNHANSYLRVSLAYIYQRLKLGHALAVLTVPHQAHPAVLLEQSLLCCTTIRHIKPLNTLISLSGLFQLVSGRALRPYSCLFAARVLVPRQDLLHRQRPLGTDSLSTLCTSQGTRTASGLLHVHLRPAVLLFLDLLQSQPAQSTRP